MTPYPRIKRNLQIQLNTVEGVNYVIVKEPVSGKFIRLREPEHFLLQSLDGSRAADEIADEFTRTYNKSITVDALSQFIRQMEELGFIEGSASAVSSRRRSILFVKLKAFNPDALLNRWYPGIKWLFSTPALVLQGLLIILGMSIFFANINRFPFDLSEILRAADIGTIIVSFFLMTIVHEFAHAFACKRYGGEVREMGFLLLYFQPCFYCNVSDAYLLPNKRQRLVVTLAGVIFQLALWALFSILWRITVEEYFLNRVFYLVSAVSFATLAFNLNPAIKLDGYYFLADYLVIPNLRQKAFHFVWQRVRQKVFGCRPDPLAITPTKRETKVFWWYGVFSLLYSILLIVFVVYRGGELLIGHWGWFGFLLFAVVAFVIFKRLLVKTREAVSSVWEERKWIWMRPRRIFIYAAITVVIVALSLIIEVNQITGGPAHLIAAESYTLKRVAPSLVEGRYFRAGNNDYETSQLFQLSGTDYAVTQIHPNFSVGDSVRMGDTMLVINSTMNEGLYAEAVSDLKKTQADRRLLLSNPKVEEVAKKRSEIKQAEAVYEAARKKFNRDKDLFSRQLISDDDYESSAEQFNIAQSAWDTRRNDLKLLKAGPKLEELERNDAEIEKLQSRVEYLEEQIQASTIVSPFDGIMVGTSDSKDLFHLARLETLVVEISLKESDLDILSPGDQLELRVSAFPSTPHHGNVVKYKLSPGLRAVAEIANVNRTLLPEMSGYAKVRSGKISVAGLVWRKVSRFFRLEFWSWF